MEKFYKENEGKPENKGRAEDEGSTEEGGKADEDKSDAEGKPARQGKLEVEGGPGEQAQQKGEGKPEKQGKSDGEGKRQGESKPDSQAKSASEARAAEKRPAEDYVPRKAKRKTDRGTDDSPKNSQEDLQDRHVSSEEMMRECTDMTRAREELRKRQKMGGFHWVPRDAQDALVPRGPRGVRGVRGGGGRSQRGNLSRVAAYCEDTSKLMQARCCLNQKGTILGLDLQNCSLKDPGPNFLQAYTAIIIDLQANPLKDDLANTFRGFTQLQTLILPQDVPCPGGSNAWDNVTSFKDKQICQGQRDLCNSTGSPEMCPENGSCASDGPGLLQCVCADGFHGYKCMRQGSFSLLMFFGILGSTTLAISILLWGTQRRKAKAS